MESKNLEEKISNLNDQISTLTKERDLFQDKLNKSIPTRDELIESILSKMSSQERSNLSCTCDGQKFNERIQCIKHPSRYFPNKGCFWCNYTDCSQYGC